MERRTTGLVGLEHDSSLTGTFEVSLTRAVLPYRDDADRLGSGGRIQDIGLGVVIDGTDPARADVVDLGSAELRVADLTGPVVVLGWLYPSGLRSFRRVVEGAEGEGSDRARGFTFDMALRALQGSGFGPATLPTVLRIGFRDLCRDLDLHESTALRLLLPSGGVARFHLDYDGVTLIVRTARASRDRDLEIALADALSGTELLRATLGDALGGQTYHLPLPVPRSLKEARAVLGTVRKGFVRLLARFEPERFRALSELTATFGERDSLETLHDRLDVPRLERVVLARGGSGGLGDVH
jgi:hypothetical protein